MLGGFFSRWFFGFGFSSVLWRLGQAFNEGYGRAYAAHVAPLMWPALIMADEIVIENGLHVLNGFKSSLTSLDTGVLGQQRAVGGLHNSI